MPTFFNPAANLTANRIPYALGGGRLGDDAALTFDPGTKAFSLVGGALSVSKDAATLLSVFRSNSTPANVGFQFGADNSGPYITTAVTHNFRFFTSGAEKARFDPAGDFLLGSTSNLSNGRAQIATHTTAAGGIGFFDFSLYRDGAASLRTNANVFRVGPDSNNGQILAGYGSFAAPSVVPGDSGGGFYQRWDGALRWLTVKGYAGRTEFRKSDDASNLFELTDASAKFFAPLWLDNAHQAGAPAATGYVTVRDSAGNVMKLLCSNV